MVMKMAKKREDSSFPLFEILILNNDEPSPMCRVIHLRKRALCKLQLGEETSANSLVNDPRGDLLDP